ncbi:hypothetical protein J4573_45265 [Actinomadura barringtoniae]|uniref:Uncharacterized protein n=1 Tax=Actinomadura barringtoniae TaxID=1427535 RepID=A0A939PQL7_9ACTN|nr:hypothetical protein [Actinomadura barringtoniae]MBO2454364.1 hypothetical protein [Actinomadura barringtoniae]
MGSQNVYPERDTVLNSLKSTTCDSTVINVAHWSFTRTAVAKKLRAISTRTTSP